MADDWDWPPNWLNDGVKGWLSSRDLDEGSKVLFRTYPSEDEPGLRGFIASPSYLFAMKCLAMRLGGVEVSRDRSDIEALGRELGITTSEAAIEAVRSFYPGSRIMPKTVLGIEEIFGGREGPISEDD